ncbi:ATP-binding protein [Cytobacillus praedii]|uniref:ATP-binding protein n=1 Tax=Cytobacillus praedii TaxID=1742358 RepID=UPI000710048C|nr:ATP-binding protein [Cytobacillus praedii]
MIETLLLNFLFLLIPVLAYLIFFENRKLYFSKYILIILASISMLLCMTFPIYLDNGFIFDLRLVPFILAILYGGYKNAFFIYIFLNVYRFYIGGDGIFQSFLFSTLVFVLVSLSSRKFVRLLPRHRIYFATAVSFITIIFYLTTLSFQTSLNKEYWILSIHALMAQVIMMVVLTCLLEKIIANMKAREAFLQSERYHLISELSASVAHEIRNPLTVTSGFLQLLSKSESISPKEKTYVEFSLQELNRAEQIVSDFLAFSKPQSDKMVYSDLKEETEYVKNILIPYARMHNVDIQLSFHNSLAKKFDKSQMQQCLINLYKNGIEAMKEKGGILSIEVSEHNRNILITIKDTGNGMTAEEVSNIGKPYYSTKVEGTGLGMLMVHSIIHKLKAQIKVESEKGKGTTFTITIPV